MSEGILERRFGLASLLSIQTVFDDTVDFKLYPVIDIRQALKAGVEEPTGLL